MANPAAKHADEFRRETADYVISTGRPISECCRELGLNSKTVNQWAIKRRRELSGQPSPKAEDRELREARKRIRELEMENAFLKKSRGLLRQRAGVAARCRPEDGWSAERDAVMSVRLESDGRFGFGSCTRCCRRNSPA